MEVSVQLQAPAAFPREKSHRYLVDSKETRLAPSPVWTWLKMSSSNRDINMVVKFKNKGLFQYSEVCGTDPCWAL